MKTQVHKNRLKKTFSFFAILSVIFMAVMLSFNPLSLQAQNGDPPPPPNQHGQNGNQVPGGGAPIGGGLLVLATIATGYGLLKVRKYRVNKLLKETGKAISLAMAFLLFPYILAGQGNMLDFDGANDYCEGTGLTYPLTTFTIETWVYHNTLSASINRYVTYGDDGAVLRHDGVNQQGQLHFYVNTVGGLQHLRVNNVLETGKWYHVAGTYDGTDMKLYVNGSLVGTESPASACDAANGNLRLSHPTTTLDGYLDEVRLWNDVRTQTEIRQNMLVELAGTESGLIGYWKLNESTGSTANDAVGSVDLTLYNMDNSDWVTSTAPFNLDFGDAPAPYYVTKSEIGACHNATGPTLGATRDAESDGSHSATADGDGADEDGISNWQNVKVGKPDASVTVNVHGSAAFLDAWIDWNGDGSWGGKDDQIADNLPVSVGNNVVYFDVPSDILAKTTYARFRLSSYGNLGIISYASDGEVEDYQLTITQDPQTAVFLKKTYELALPGIDVNHIEAADMDNDGDMDIILAGRAAYPKRMLRNDGNLTFTQVNIDDYPSYECQTYDMTVADMNKDGYKDIMEAVRIEGLQMSIYDGNLTYYPSEIVGSTGTYECMSLGDINNDGDLDMIAGGGSVNSLFMNDGNENFTEYVIGGLRINRSVVIIDWDHDGDLDAMASRSTFYGNYALFINDGSNQFTEQSINITVGSRDTEVADLDNDGDYDVVISDNDDKLYWYENNGSDVFTSYLLIDNTPENWDIHVADINGDGFLDILAGDILLNDGNGGFPALLYFDRENVSIAVDIDGNGMLDIVQGGDDDILKIYFQDEYDFGDAPLPYSKIQINDGAFHLRGGPKLGSQWDADNDSQASAQADGDDNDGTDDEDGVSNWQNFTVGALGASVDVNIQNGPVYLNAWIDWNHDGTLGGPHETIADDLPVSNGNHTLVFDVPEFAVAGQTIARFRVSEDGHNGVYSYGEAGEVEDYAIALGQKPLGSANFSEAKTISNTIAFAWDAKIQDLDDDGDMDIVGPSKDGPSGVYWFENDGSANFSINTITDTVDVQFIYIIDLDGDMDKDILFFSDHSNDKNSLTWAENDGNENFTGHFISNMINYWVEPIAADFDQDGDLDIYADYNGFYGWFENDGNENFTFVDKVSYSGNLQVTVDLDQDGDIDLVSPRMWFENDGNGNFTSHTISSDVGDMIVHVVDIDGDSDLDIISSSPMEGYSISLLSNDGYQNFTHTVLEYGGVTARFFDVKDIEGDGDFDIIFTKSGDPCIMFNDGSGNFTKVILDSSGNAKYCTVAGDLDGDNFMDIFWSTQNSDHQVGWIRQSIVKTADVSKITFTIAQCGGNVMYDLGYSITARGVCWNTTGYPTTADNYTTDGVGTGTFTSTLTGLAPNSQYYVRAYATNSQGVYYGNQFLFQTLFSPPGNALNFDGVNEYVDLGNSSVFDVGNTLTIECWVKPDDLSERYSLFSTRDENSPGSFQLEIGPANGGTNCVAVSGPSTWVIQTADNVIATGEWTHLAYSRSGTGTGTHSLYINGVSVALTETAFDYANNTDDKVIASGTSGGQNYDGKMDEVRIWNVARSETEIRQSMHRTLNGDEANLVAYYRFDATIGTQLADGTSNDNHGTLVYMENSDWVESGALWKRWEGNAKSSDWSAAANWSTTFSPPTANDQVMIEATATQAVISNAPATPALCTILKINSGATLNIAEGKALTVSDSIINLAGISGLVLNSNSGGTASLIHSSSGADATVERYIPAYVGNAGWHDLSSPVAAQAIRPGFVASPTPAASDDFYKFSEPDYLWISVKDNAGNWNNNFEDDFVVGRGYNIAYANNETKSFTGELNVGDVTFDGTTTPAITVTGGKGEGWNLMGNPYPSALDWDDCEITNIGAAVYTYDGAAGQYVSWNGTTGGLNQGIIPPMNGFFIKASAGASLTIPNSAREHSSINFYKEKEYVKDLLVLKVEGNGYSDKTFVHFNGDATNNFDSEYDAWKLSGIYEAPQLYTMSGNDKHSINVLPYTSEEIAIPLCLKVGKECNYQISVSENSFWETVDVSLKDLLTGNTYNLITNNSITINQSTSFPDRFLLLINGATGIEESQPGDDGIQIYSYGDQLFIKTDEPGVVQVTVCNLIGQIVASQTLSGLPRKLSGLSGLDTGLYLVSVRSKSAIKTKKVFVR